jgi:signal transduction histidine kinase
MLYGGLFLVAGAILLAITYGLVQGSVGVSAKQSVVLRGPRPRDQGVFLQQTAVSPGVVPQVPPGVPIEIRAAARHLQAEAQAQVDSARNAQRNALLTESGVALAIMAFLSIGLGWLMAGRALAPLRVMAVRARGISERNLHERLALAGPDDELKELGDTFDGLLGRLETAFESQRRFVANASHELRTPITLERTLVEVALADPEASIDSLRDTCRRVLAASEQQERLIGALLTLARSQRGLAARERLDLSAVMAHAVRDVDRNGIRLDSELGEAQTAGDPHLLELLIANLLDNAVKYNDSDGWVKAWTGVRDGQAAIEIENTGPVVAPEEAAQLAEPFRRLNGGREEANPSGLGLGLSIVAAIADAHGARLTALPRSEGGLRVEVSFPHA